MSAVAAHTVAVCARDAAGNRCARSAAVTFTTHPGGSTTCAVDYRIAHQWPGGFQGDVRIRNTGTSAISGWTLRWTFATGQTVTQMWHATASRTGAQVSATNAAHTATFAAGGSVGLGFTGTWTGSNAVPTACTLNGASCAGSRPIPAERRSRCR